MLLNFAATLAMVTFGWMASGAMGSSVLSFSAVVFIGPALQCSEGIYYESAVDSAWGQLRGGEVCVGAALTFIYNAFMQLYFVLSSSSTGLATWAIPGGCLVSIWLLLPFSNRAKRDDESSGELLGHLLQ